MKVYLIAGASCGIHYFTNKTEAVNFYESEVQLDNRTTLSQGDVQINTETVMRLLNGEGGYLANEKELRSGWIKNNAK